jgi:hypothetical protein
VHIHPRSQRNRFIGLVGLGWFIFCTATAVFIPLFAADFRAWSHFTWTDREIYIGAACYFVVGLAGLLLAVTRLLLPMFGRSARIGYDVARPLMMIDVPRPRFEDFHALGAATAARAAWSRAFVTLFFGAIIFIIWTHPMTRHEGVPFKAALTTFAVAVAAKTVFPLVRTRLLTTRWGARLRWELFGRHGEPRRYHVFEDGILIQRLSGGQRRVPWYDARHACLIGNTIGMLGRGELIVIPGDAMPTQAMADTLMDVMARNRVAFVNRPAAATNLMDAASPVSALGN